eukprot:355090_1
MQIGIIGKGSMGKCLAHKLHQSTHYTSSLLVKPTTFNSLLSINYIHSNQCNITFHPLEQDQSIEISKICILPLDTTHNNKFDLIVILTKSFQSLEALQQLESNNFLTNNPTVILFHNGMISTCRIPRFVNDNNIPLLFGTTLHGATTAIDDDPFTIRHKNFGPTWIGFKYPFNKIHSKISQSELCMIFDSAFYPTKWYNDLEPHLLYKLAINCCVNPLTAIYQIRTGQLHSTCRNHT